MSTAVIAFNAAFKRGLRSGAYAPIDIVQAVKNIGEATELRECLDDYCRYYDPANPPAKRETLELARTTGYNLFKRALEISNPVNGLLEMLQTLPVLDSNEPDAKLRSKHYIYAKRYRSLGDKDRNDLQRDAKYRADQRKAGHKTFLITDIEEQYRRKYGRAHQSTDQLRSFLADAPVERKAFEKVVAPCEEAWTASRDIKRRPTTKAALDALDAAFDAYAQYLRDTMRQPIDFLRNLTWLREAVSEQPHHLSKRMSWPNVWVELYLDTVHRAQTLAASKWNIGSLIHARAFVGVDAIFILEPFKARERKLLTERLKKGFTDVNDFAAFHRGRRRCTVAGQLRGLDILDEQETEGLAGEIKQGWKNDAIAVASRKFTTRSERIAFQSTFHINETAEDVFTILWIPRGVNPTFVYIEVHQLPGFAFRANVVTANLAGMLEDKVYEDLAKNAQALTVFLLAYLQILGYALDVATAGASGGLRFIILRFAEERLKEQALAIGFEIAGIDNPWIQTAVGFATGFIPSAIPKPRGLNIPHDLDLPVSAQRGIDPRPPSGTPSSLDRGTINPHIPIRAPEPPRVIGTETWAVPAAAATSPKAPPLLTVVPEHAPASMKPRPEAAPLTEVEQLAVREQGAVMADYRLREEIQFKNNAVANDNSLVAQSQLVVNGSARGTQRPPSGVPGKYIVSSDKRVPTSGRKRTPALGEAPHDQPLTKGERRWQSRKQADERMTNDRLRQKEISELFYQRQEHFGLGAEHEALTGMGGTSMPTPGGKRMSIPKEAGLFVHKPEYAEALRGRLGNPRMPAGFSAQVKSGEVVKLASLPDGLRAEVGLGITSRADRLTVVDGVVYELKPNRAAAIEEGLSRVLEYVALARNKFPERANWRGVVVIYDADEARRLMVPK